MLIKGANAQLNTVFYLIYEHLSCREKGYLYKAPFVDLRFRNTDKSVIMKSLRELNLVPESVLNFKFQKNKYNKIKKLILFKK